MKKLKIKQKSNRRGFTLVELVIVIAVVIILSVISVPIYRGYIDKSKISEGYALLGALISAQKAYYSEHGNFLLSQNGSGGYWTNNEEVLGIDARGNKYFTWFRCGPDETYNPKTRFWIATIIPADLRKNSTLRNLAYIYNINSGGYYEQNNWW